jgi:hypothetical protein
MSGEKRLSSRACVRLTQFPLVGALDLNLATVPHVVVEPPADVLVERGLNHRAGRISTSQQTVRLTQFPLMRKAGANMITPTDADIGRQVVHTIKSAYSEETKTKCATLRAFGPDTALIAYTAAGKTVPVPFAELEWGEPKPKPSAPLDDVQREMVLADIAYLKQQEIESRARAKWEEDQAPRNSLGRIRIFRERDGRRDW